MTSTHIESICAPYRGETLATGKTIQQLVFSVDL